VGLDTEHDYPQWSSASLRTASEQIVGETNKTENRRKREKKTPR
jgi:hypothetical protein